MKYNQCTLEKTVGGHKMQIVSYIPSKFANIGQSVRLKNEEEKWDGGYIVKTVGPAVDEEFLPDRHSEIKAHRRATGDSMPKKE